MESKLWNLTIKGNDLAAYIERFQEQILLCPKMVTELREIRTNAARQVDNKRKWERQLRENCTPQQPFRRPDVTRAYTAENNERSRYAGSYPYYNKCRLHHAGPYTVKCTNCKKTGHMTRDYKNQAATTNQRALVYNQRTPVNNQRALMASQRASVTYFECGRQGY
ncbi:hypothetical protein Tco_0191652 [Tanacetum coccineum]